MIVRVMPSTIKGTYMGVPSKSLSHRLLIAAALAKGESTLSGMLDSEDITATKHALNALGIKTSGSKVYGGTLKAIKTEIDCNESGSTLRFMIPLALLLDTEITFTGRGRLPSRPLTVYEQLKNHGVMVKRMTEKALPLTLKGPLKAGIFTVPGHISSQFITGLLFALPLLKGDSIIKLSSPLESKSYVNLTLDVLALSGIKVEVTQEGYKVSGNQAYTPMNARVETDFSQAAFFIAAALIKGPLTFKNMVRTSSQGDKAILDIVKAMGGRIDYEKDTFTVHPSSLKATAIDLADIPDLGPILMVLAGLSKGNTVFTNVARLRLKESDRLGVMMAHLEALGASVCLEGETLTVKGVASFKGNLTLDSHADHRIVMALSVAALAADGPLEITQAEAINKSYPEFFTDFTALGGIVTLTERMS